MMTMMMGMVAILFKCMKPFKHIVNTPSTEGPYEIWWKLVKQFQKMFKDEAILYMYIALRKGR